MGRGYKDDDGEFQYDDADDEFAEDDDFSSFEDEDEDLLEEDGDDDEEYVDESDFSDVDTVVEEGEEMIDAGEYDKAIAHYSRAIEVFPDNALVHYGLGFAAFSKLREDAAELELWEDDADMVELYEQAMAGFDEAIELNPEHTPSLNLMGALYRLRENYDMAINTWERSLDIDPDQDEVEKDIKEAQKKLEES